MPTAVDPVRRTLDTLALDPAAANDRPYLESMLRRLGYSETEIRAALHGTPAPATPAAAPSGRGGSAPADDGDRVIEIEYTGSGTKEFILVVGVDQSELGDALGLGAGMDAGTEVFEGGPSMAEVDRLVAEGDLSDFDDWGDNALKEDAAGAKDGEGAAGVEGAGEGAEGASAQELMDGTAATGKVGGDEVAAPGPAPIDFQTGEPLVEFKPTAMNPAVIETIDPAVEAQKLRDDGWHVADPVTDQFPAEGVSAETWEAQAEPGAGGMAEGGAAAAAGTDEAGEATTWQQHGFQYGDWVLYKRDELKGDQPQRVYFFSKGTPEGAEPAALPDGYEVAENPETGRPYLRRAGSGSGSGAGGFGGYGGSGAPDIDPAHPSADPRSPPGAPKKRVRILRVRAATREEAIAKLQAEGRNVIASMPIDIEKKLR